jgi:ferric-dicitrate binding protein FerR (iron transport regulator)
VHLDAVSNLSYSEKNWNNDRSSNLAGQAYFEVNKGSTFKVNTQLGTVSILGTKFNVLQSNQLFKVDCFEGKVKVQSNNSYQVLKANENAQLEGKKLIKYTNPINKPGWIEGFSQFKETKLSEVILELKKYYKINIDLPENYATLKFTGKVPHNNLKAALQNIFIPMEINYSLNDEGKVVFS